MGYCIDMQWDTLSHGIVMQWDTLSHGIVMQWGPAMRHGMQTRFNGIPCKVQKLSIFFVDSIFSTF